MKLIPAIDLKNNKVVTSTKGKNREYKQISADLSPTSEPIEFIEHILSLNDFNTIYLADLDSIANFKANNDIINDVYTSYDLSLNSKYKVKIFNQTIDRVKNYFR